MDIIKSSVFYIEFCKEIHKLDLNDPHNKLSYSVVCLVEGKYSNVINNVSEWIDAKIEEDSQNNEIFNGSRFTYGIVTVLKNGFPGMWKKLGDFLENKNVEQGLSSMCYALEKFYYSANNDEIVDSLAKVIQENNNLIIAKELLGYSYYEMKMWNNALAQFELIENADFQERVIGNDTLFFWMAWCYGKRRDYQNEEKYYRKSLEIFDKYDFALNNLGYSFYKQKKYKEAMACFKKCIADNVNSDFASNNMVRTLLAQGKADEARKFIKNSSVNISKVLIKKAEKAAQKSEPEKPDLKDEEKTEINKNINIGVKKQQFSSEKILEDELVSRMESEIPVFGLKLKVYQKKGAYGRQYIFPHGRIDILAVDDKGDYYVIELKKDSGYDDAYTQTKNYVEWIQRHLAKTNHKTYGIICLNNPTQKLIEKVRNDDTIKLFEYNISYSEIK